MQEIQVARYKPKAGLGKTQAPIWKQTKSKRIESMAQGSSGWVPA
jgi:hypothetical protein